MVKRLAKRAVKRELKGHCALPVTCAWSSIEAAEAKAREMLRVDGKDWYERLAQVLGAARSFFATDFETYERHRTLQEAAERLEQAVAHLEAAARLVDGADDQRVDEPLTPRDVRSLRVRVRRTATAGHDALEVARRIAKATGSLPEHLRFLTRITRRVRETAGVGWLTPQRFVETVLAEVWPDAPRSPSAWAYFAISEGLDEPIRRDGRPDQQRVAWQARIAKWHRRLARIDQRCGLDGPPRPYIPVEGDIPF